MSTSGESREMVSVVITSYNQARFLADSIDSVLQQTYPCVEIAVVDDGSQDCPEAIVKRYPSVSFVRQSNQGVAVARNRGWRASRGGFVVFLDADDRLLPAAVELGRESLSRRAECGFVFGRGTLVDAQGRPLPSSFTEVAGWYGYAHFLEHNPIAFPALAMHRRRALEAVGGFTSIVDNVTIGNASDYDLYLRMSGRFPVYAHGELVAAWRQHTANTSRQSLMMLRSTVAVLASQRAVARASRRYEKARQRGLRRLRQHYGEQLIEELRAEWRNGDMNWGRFASSVVALLRHYPEGMILNAARKARQTLKGVLRVGASG